MNLQCPKCGGLVDADWQYCLHCGNRLGSSAFAQLAPRRKLWNWLTALLSVAIVGLFAVVFALAWFAYDLDTRLDETDSRLSVSQAELSQVTADRDQLDAQLNEVKTDLEDAEESLAIRGRELDAERESVSRLENELDAAEADVARLEGVVDETQTNLQAQQQRAVLQSGQIAVLKSCLGGVLEALYWASYGYWTDAEIALLNVEGSCNQAANYF